MLTATVLAVSVVAPLLLLVLVLIKCLGCLRKQDGFKNFENEDSRMEARINPGFAMGQDIEETERPPLSTTAIQIEPLPELLSETTSRKPKITCVEKSRQESALKLVVVNNPYPFPRRQLKYLNEIGSGWFGQVLESDAEHITTGIPLSRVVAKVLKDDASNSEKKLFLEDVLPYRELEHDNVLRLLAQCTESNPYLMILEYAPLGDLKACAKKQQDRGNTDNYRLVKFARDAASGLACLHRHGYIHQDFAARNCVVMGDFKVKVGDYGISEDIYKSDYYETGNEMLPVRWMSPESLSQQSGVWQTAVVTREANIWSFGVLLWEMLNYGEQPYTNMSDTQVLQSVVEDRLMKLPEPSLDIQHRDRIFEVMQFCWLNPGERPSIEEAHGLLQQLINITSGAEQKQENFEKKWNQTIPSEARVVSAKPSKQTRRPASASFESDFSPVPTSEPAQQVLSPGFDELTSVKVESSLSTSIVNMPSDVSDDVAHLQTPFQPKLAGMMTSTPVMDPAQTKPDESDIMKKSNTSGSKTSRKIEEDFERVSVKTEKSPGHDVEKKVQDVSVAEKKEDSSIGFGSEEVKPDRPAEEVKPDSLADPFQNILADVKSSLPTVGAAQQDVPESKQESVADGLQNGLHLDTQMDVKKEMDVFSFDSINTQSNGEMSKKSTEKLITEANVDLIDQGTTDLLVQGNLDLDGNGTIDLGGQGDFISKSEHALDVSESSSDNKTDSSAKCDMQSAVPDSTKMAANLGKQTSFEITADSGSSQQSTVQSSNVDFLEMSRSSPNSFTKVSDNLVSSTFQQKDSLPSEIDVPQETDEPDSKTGDTKTSDIIIENGSSGYETHSVDQSKSESNDANSTLGTDSSSDSAVCVSSPELADAPSSFEGSAPPSEKVGTCIEYLSDDENESSCSDSNSSTDSTNSGRSYECQERNPNIQVTDLDASDDSYDTDDDHDNRYSYETTDSDEDMDLRIASELYLSKGVSSPQVFERPPLETIPEDVMPSPSDTSSVDLKFDTQFDDVFASQDNFEWDDFMGESIVGRDRSGVSPKASFDMSDWMLEGDSMSFRSNSSIRSQGGSLGSDVTGASDPNPSTPSVSEVKRGRGRTSRSYVSDLITNHSINPSFTNTKNTRTPFYSLYDTLELDGDSDGGRTSPDSNSLPESHPSESVAVALHDNEEQITLASQPDDSLYIQNDSLEQPKSAAEILEEADAANQIHLGESHMAAGSSAVAADRESTDSGQGQSVSVTESAPKDLNSAFEKLASQHNIGLEMFSSNEESAADDKFNEFGFESLATSKDIDLFDDFPSSDEPKNSELPSVASFFTGVDIPKVPASSNKKVSSEAPESLDHEIESNVSPQEPPVGEDLFKSEIVEHQTQSPEGQDTEPEIQSLESVESPSFESPNQIPDLSPEPTDALENQNIAEGDNSMSQSIEILESENSLVESKEEVIAHSVADSFPFSIPTNLPEIEAKSLENDNSMSDVKASSQSVDFDVQESFVDITSISSDSVSQTVPSIEDQEPESFTLLASRDLTEHAPTATDADGSVEFLDQITEDASMQLQSPNTKESVSETMKSSDDDGSKQVFEGILGPNILKDNETKDDLSDVEAETQKIPVAFGDDQSLLSQEPDFSVDALTEREESQRSTPDSDVHQNVAGEDQPFENISQSANDVPTFESGMNDTLPEPPLAKSKETQRTFSMTEPNKVLNMFDDILYSEDTEPPTTPSELKDHFDLGVTPQTPDSNQTKDVFDSRNLKADDKETNSDTLEATDEIDAMDIQTLDFLGASPENNQWTQQMSDDETEDVSDSGKDTIKDDYIPPSLDLFRPPTELIKARQTVTEQAVDFVDDSLKSTEDANLLSVPVNESIIEPEESSSILLSQPLVESSLVQPFDEPLKAEARAGSSMADDITCVTTEPEMKTSTEQQVEASESNTDHDVTGGNGSGDQTFEFIDNSNIDSTEFGQTTEFVSLSGAVTTESNDLLSTSESKQDALVVPDSNSIVDKSDDSEQNFTEVDSTIPDQSGSTGEGFIIPEESVPNTDITFFDQVSVKQPSDLDGNTVPADFVALGAESKTDSGSPLDFISGDLKDNSLQTSEQTASPSPVPDWDPLTTSADLVDNLQSEQTFDTESMDISSETTPDSSPVSDWGPISTPSDLANKDNKEALDSDPLPKTPIDTSPVQEWEPLTTPSEPVDNRHTIDVQKTDSVPELEPLATLSGQDTEGQEPELEEVKDTEILLTPAEESSSPSPVTDWEPLATLSGQDTEGQEPELEEAKDTETLLTPADESSSTSPVTDWEPLTTASNPLDRELPIEKQEPKLEGADNFLNNETLLKPTEEPSIPSPVPEWEPLATLSGQDTEGQEPELEEAKDTETLLTPADESSSSSQVTDWEPLTTPSNPLEKQEPKLEGADNFLNNETLLKPTEEPSIPSPVPEWEPLATLSGQDTEEQEPKLGEAKDTETLLTPAEESSESSPVTEREPLATLSGQDTEGHKAKLEDAKDTEILLTPAEEPSSPSPVQESVPLATLSGQNTEGHEPELEEANHSLNNETLLTPAEESSGSSPVPEWEPLSASPSLIGRSNDIQFSDPAEEKNIKDVVSSCGTVQEDQTDTSVSEKKEIPEASDSLLDDFVKVNPDESFSDKANSEENANYDVISQDTANDEEVKTSGSGSSDENSFLLVDEQQVQKSLSNESFSDISDGFKDAPNQSIDFPDSSMTDSQESAVFLDLSDNDKSQINATDVDELGLVDTKETDVPRKGSILDSEIPESAQKTTTAGGLFESTTQPDNLKSQDGQSVSADGLVDFNADVEGKLTEFPKKDQLLDHETAQTDNLSDFDSVQRKGSILDSEIHESTGNIFASGLLDTESQLQETEVPRKSSLLDLDVNEPQESSSPFTGGLMDLEFSTERKDSSQDVDVPRKGSILDMDVPEPKGIIAESTAGLLDFDNIERERSIHDPDNTASNVDTFGGGLLDFSTSMPVEVTEIPRKGSILDLDVPEAQENISVPLTLSDIESVQRKGSILDSDVPDTDEKVIAGGLLDFDTGVQGLEDAAVPRKDSILDLDEPEPQDIASGGLLDLGSENQVKALVDDAAVPRKGSILDFDVPEPRGTIFAPEVTAIDSVERKGSILDLDNAETDVVTSAGGLVGSEGPEVQRKDSLLELGVPESNHNTQSSVEGLLDLSSGVERKDSLLEIPETLGNNSSEEGLLVTDSNVQSIDPAGQEHTAPGLLNFGLPNQTDGEQLESLMKTVDSSSLSTHPIEMKQEAKSEGDPIGIGQSDAVPGQPLTSVNPHDSLQGQSEVDIFGLGDVQPDQIQTSHNVQSSVQGEVDPFGETGVELIQTEASPQSQTQVNPFGILGTDLEPVQTQTSGNSLQSQLDNDPFGIDANNLQTGQSLSSDSNFLFDFSASNSTQNPSQIPESSATSQDMFGGLLDLSSSAPVGTQPQGDQSGLLDIFGSQDTPADNHSSKKGDPATSTVDLL